jgi:hypothetical protein
MYNDILGQKVILRRELRFSAIAKTDMDGAHDHYSFFITALSCPPAHSSHHVARNRLDNEALRERLARATASHTVNAYPDQKCQR